MRIKIVSKRNNIFSLKYSVMIFQILYNFCIMNKSKLGQDFLKGYILVL